VSATPPEAITVDELEEQLWQLVTRPTVDRGIAIEAVSRVLDTLRTDHRLDKNAGRLPTNRPS
jgi:hypothetical protein